MSQFQMQYRQPNRLGWVPMPYFHDYRSTLSHALQLRMKEFFSRAAYWIQQHEPKLSLNNPVFDRVDRCKILEDWLFLSASIASLNSQNTSLEENEFVRIIEMVEAQLGLLEHFYDRYTTRKY